MNPGGAEKKDSKRLGALGNVGGEGKGVPSFMRYPPVLREYCFQEADGWGWQAIWFIQGQEHLPGNNCHDRL